MTLNAVVDERLKVRRVPLVKKTTTVPLLLVVPGAPTATALMDVLTKRATLVPKRDRLLDPCLDTLDTTTGCTPEAYSN